MGFSAPQRPDCKRPLGLEKGRILNGSITASSQENENAGPKNARLNFKGAWSPLDLEQNQWLQVDFGAETRITGISTQGHYNFDTWVESYTLRYSDDGSNFEHYQVELYTKVNIEKQFAVLVQFAVLIHDLIGRAKMNQLLEAQWIPLEHSYAPKGHESIKQGWAKFMISLIE